MKAMLKKMMLGVALMLAGMAGAAATGTLVTFSSTGPDAYPDGTTVVDGEYYALAWAEDAAKLVMGADGTVADGRVLAKVSVAEDGRCPPVNVKLDDETASACKDGAWGVFLLDTRGSAAGEPVIRSATRIEKATVEIASNGFLSYTKIGPKLLSAPGITDGVTDNPAAAIGSTGYATLADAIAAATAGDTVTLLAAVEVNTAIVVDKSLTLDLNNQTLTLKYSNFKQGSLKNTAPLTVVGGTITSTGPSTAAGGTIYGITYENDLTLRNVTISAESKVPNTTSVSPEGKVCAVYGKSGNLVVENCTLSATAKAKNSTNHAYGIYVESTGGSVGINGSTLTVANSTVSNASYGNECGLYLAADVVPVIVNSTVPGITIASTNAKDITLGTGCFTSDTVAGFTHGIDYAGTGTLTIDGITVNAGTYSSSCGIYNRGTGTVVIKDGSTVSSTVSDAVNNFSKGSVVVDGGTITSTYSNSSGVRNNSTGDVTINGGTITGGYGVYNNSTGSVAIDDGTVTGTNTGSNQGSVYNNGNGTVDISGGTIAKTGSGNAVNANKGTISISGGTIDGTLKKSSTGTVVVTGGTYTQDPAAMLAEGSFADEDNGTWTVASPVAIVTDGNGNRTDFDDLHAALEEGKTRGYTVKLMRDVDLTGVNWVPVGTTSSRFEGAFDGNGKTISNLHVEMGGDGAGLFGCVHGGNWSEEWCTVGNVILSNVYVHANQYVAAFVGGGTTGSPYPRVKDVILTGTIDIYGHKSVGGIAGSLCQGNAVGCSVIGDGTGVVESEFSATLGDGENVGGLVGHFETDNVVRLQDCSVSGITVLGPAKVGGVTGVAFLNSKLENISAKNVKVGLNTTTGYTAEEGNYKLGVGGLVGLYYTATANGKISGMVEEVEIIANENNIDVSYGLVTGGFKGASKPDLPTDPMLTAPGYDKTGLVAIGYDAAKYSNAYLINNYLAMITDGDGKVTGYDDLQTALSAANDGDTVTLLADDASFTQDVAWSAGSRTLLFNGFTESGTAKFVLSGTATLTTDDAASVGATEGYMVVSSQDTADPFHRHYSIQPLVAKIGDNEYGSLKDAFAAAQNDDVIKIFSTSISETATSITVPAGTTRVTVDLNGKAVAPSGTSVGPLVTSIAGVEIKVIDSVGGGSVSVNSTSYAAVTANKAGTVVVDAGTYNNSKGNAVNSSTAGAVVTINDGTFASTGTSSTYAALKSSNGTITVNYGTFNGGTKACAASISGGSLTVNDGDFSGAIGANVSGGSTVVTVNGGEFTSVGTGTSDAAVKVGSGTVTINDGSFTSATKYALYLSSGSGKLYVKGGKFSGNLYAPTSGTTWKFEVSGGIFSVNPSTVTGVTIAENYHVVANTDEATSSAYPWTLEPLGVAKINDTYYPTLADAITAANEAEVDEITILNGATESPDADWKVADGKLVRKTYVAKIGETKYETIDELLAGLQTAIVGGSYANTITFLADVELADNFVIPQEMAQCPTTFDLNGKHITLATGKTHAIRNYGQITLVDSVGGGSVTAPIPVINESGATFNMQGGTLVCNEQGRNAVQNEGTFNMTGGSLQVSYVGSSSDSFGSACLSNSGTATITKGTLTSVNQRAYAIINSGTLTINPAADSDVAVTGAHGAVAVDGGTVSISGGSYTATNYYALYVSNEASDPTVTVTGGTFDGNAYSAYIGSDVNESVTASVAISGGTFNDPIIESSKVADGSGFAISGGNFTTAVAEDYCATGYIPAAKDPETVMYTVKQGAYVAKIGTTKYESLADAVAAVPTDGTETTITMLAGETIAADAGITIAAGKNIVLDLNGQTVQMAAASADERWLIKNAGALTVKDSAENGKLLMSATGQASTAVRKSTIKNMGSLTVESGTIELTYSGTTKEEPTTILNDASDCATSLTVKGGTVVNSANRGTGVYLAVNDTNATVVDVQGGRVEGYGSAVRYYFDDRALTDAKLTFSMSNGTIHGRGMYGIHGMTTSSKDWNGISFDISGGTISCVGLLGRKHVISPLQGAVSISGGTFNGDVYIYGHDLEITDGNFAGSVTLHRTKESLESASISGGQFISGLTIAETTADNTTNPYYNAKFITGGIYGTAPEARNVVDEYAVVDNTDSSTQGDYPKTIGGAVASVTTEGNTTYYATFNDAIAAADEAGVDEITILNGATESPDSAWKVADGKLVRTTYVAQIVRGGEVVAKYETLAAAIADAMTGDTVQLLANVTENVSVNKAITIDGQTYTLTGDGNSTVLAVDGGVTVEVKNIVIDGAALFNGLDGTVKVTGYSTLALGEGVSIKNGIYCNLYLDRGSVTGSQGVTMVGGDAVVNDEGKAIYGDKDITAAVQALSSMLNGGSSLEPGTTIGLPYFDIVRQRPDGDIVNIADGEGRVKQGASLLFLANGDFSDAGQGTVTLPTRFYSYTLNIANVVGATGWTEGEWNDIIDTGCDTIDLIAGTGQGDKPMSETVDVTLKLNEDVAIPGEDGFEYRNSNFTIDGNDHAISGTIVYTDNAGTMENVVMGTEEEPLVLDMTGLSEGNSINLGSGIAATNVTIKVTETQAATQGTTIVTWNAGEDGEEEAASLAAGVTVAIVDATTGEPVKDEQGEDKTASLMWDAELGIGYIGPCEARLTTVDANSETVYIYTSLAHAIELARDSGDTVTLMMDIENFTGTQDVNKSLVLDGAGHTIKADASASSTGAMFNVRGDEVVIKNMTIDGDHKYWYCVQALNGACTLQDMTILNGAQRMGDEENPQVGYGSAVHVNGANLRVSGEFNAIGGGKTAGVFPFTAILYSDGTVYFADGAEADIGEDLLLVGMGPLNIDTFMSTYDIEEKLAEMNIPGAYIPYTLALDGTNSGMGFVGASPQPWNTIIDYGKEIMEVATEIGFGGFDMEPDTTPVEVGLLTDTELPDTFNYADTNFTVNGNGNALSGTIKYTDEAGIIKNIVLGTEEKPLILDLREVTEPVEIGNLIGVTNVTVLMTAAQATLGQPVFTWNVETAGEPDNAESVKITVLESTEVPYNPEDEAVEKGLVWDDELGIAYIGPCEARLTGPEREPGYMDLTNAFNMAVGGDTVTLFWSGVTLNEEIAFPAGTLVFATNKYELALGENAAFVFTNATSVFRSEVAFSTDIIALDGDVASGYLLRTATDGTTNVYSVVQRGEYIVTGKTEAGTDGTAVIKVSDEWIVANMSKTSIAEIKTINEVEEYLDSRDSTTGMRKWENYVLKQTENPFRVNGIAASGALSTTLSDTPEATATTGFTVQYALNEVEANGTVKTAGTKSDGHNFSVAVDSVASSALYKVRAYLTSGESMLVVDSTNTLGVLKVQPTIARSIIAVPWKSLETGGDITVAEYIRTADLSANDELHIYNGSSYDTWTYSDGNWSAVKTFIAGKEGTDTTVSGSAETTTLARGTGVWLERAGDAAPLYLVGEYSPEASETPVVAGSTSAMSWNLVGAPSFEQIDLNTAIGTPVNAADRIVVPMPGGLQKNFTYKKGKWGYSDARTIEVNGRTRVQTFHNTNAVLPAGTGFWYLNTGDAGTIKW